jgi:hypothetical protein
MPSLRVKNIARKQLNPYEEAKAVHAMVARGLTEEGAAQALGWPKIAAALEDWKRAAGEVGAAQAVLIARDNSTRAALNTAAREHVGVLGHLGEDVHYGPVTVAVGDRIICRRPARGRAPPDAGQLPPATSLPRDESAASRLPS